MVMNETDREWNQKIEHRTRILKRTDVRTRRPNNFLHTLIYTRPSTNTRKDAPAHVFAPSLHAHLHARTHARTIEDAPNVAVMIEAEERVSPSNKAEAAKVELAPVHQQRVRYVALDQSLAVQIHVQHSCE